MLAWQVSVVRPGSLRDKVFSVGFVRKSTFKNKLLGNTSSELVELTDNGKRKQMAWRVRARAATHMRASLRELCPPRAALSLRFPPPSRCRPRGAAIVD